MCEAFGDRRRVFCVDCEQIACGTCLFPGEAHCGHHIVKLDEGLRLVVGEHERQLQAIRESVSNVSSAGRNRKVLAKRIRNEALRTVGSINEHIDEVMRNLERVRVALVSAVQRAAQHTLASAMKTVHLRSRAKLARNATQFDGATRQFLRGATFTQLLKRKAATLAQRVRVENVAAQQRRAAEYVEPKLGTLVDERFVSELATLRKTMQKLSDETDELFVSGRYGYPPH